MALILRTLVGVAPLVGVSLRPPEEARGLAEVRCFATRYPVLPAPLAVVPVRPSFFLIWLKRVEAVLPFLRPVTAATLVQSTCLSVSMNSFCLQAEHVIAESERRRDGDVRWTYVQGAVVVLDDCEEDGSLLGADVGEGHVGVRFCRFVLERCCLFILEKT